GWRIQSGHIECRHRIRLGESDAGIEFQDRVDEVDEQRFEPPLPQLPPPPWPPSAAPAELDTEMAGRIGDRGGTGLLCAAPPPEIVHVIRAYLRAGDGTAIGADHTAVDHEFATPGEPETPPAWRQDQRGQIE